MELSVENLLKKSGWFHGRTIDVKEIRDMYDREGYIYNQLQIEFMKEFAYIEINYQHPVWKQEVEFIINPIVAQESMDMDMVKEYEEFFGCQFLIIGEIERENMTVFMDQSGELYGAFDDCVIKWGNDLHNMIYKLINGIKGELVIIE
jgi:hypothetical protein